MPYNVLFLDRAVFSFRGILRAYFIANLQGNILMLTPE